MEKFIRIHLYSVGAWLLALATVLVLATFQGQPSNYVPVRDPFFGLRLPVLYWLAGGISLLAAVYCLFGRQTGLQLGLVLWLATNTLVASLGLRFMDAKGGLRGYLGEMSDVLGVSTDSMAWLLAMSVGYLFVGSLVAMTLLGRLKKKSLLHKMTCAACGGHIEFPLPNLGEKIPCQHCLASITLGGSQPVAVKPGRVERSQEAVIRTIKIACTACGGHIEFPTNFFGERIPCPHCQTSIILQKAATLKMSCHACDGHIAFPDHALGQTIPCPHCHRDIMLKETTPA